MLFNSADWRLSKVSASMQGTMREARNVMCWRDYLGKEVKHVRLGRNIFNNRYNCSGIRIWRDRRGVGGNCQVPILSVPGDVPYLRDLWVARQRSAIIRRTAVSNPEVLKAVD